MSNPSYPLLQPGRIGTLELRNRIVMAPMGSNFFFFFCTCGARIQAYYEARAKGGAGLLTMGVCSVAYPHGTSEPFQVGISRDDFIPGLKSLVDRVHRHGAKIALQLHHGGKTAALDRAQGREIWVPSIPQVTKSDMMATIAALLGEKLPNDAGEDSFDILPLLRGEKPATPIRHGMVHVNYGSYTLAIRDGDWKLILPSWIYTVKDGTITPDTIVETTGKGPIDKFQLYNLRTDPSETTNVFMQEPDKARELFTALKADIARGRSR